MVGSGTLRSIFITRFIIGLLLIYSRFLRIYSNKINEGPGQKIHRKDTDDNNKNNMCEYDIKINI